MARATRIAGFVALAALGCRGDRPSPVGDAGAPAAAIPALTPEHAVAAARAWLHALHAHDARALDPLVSPTVVMVPGDPKQNVVDIDGVVLRGWVASEHDATHCEPEVVIATATDAVALALCDKQRDAQRPPTPRSAHYQVADELHFDARGAIDRVVYWTDILRTFRQLDVDVDVDAAPDTQRAPAIALARGDATEAANTRAAHELVAALGRGDPAAIASWFAPGYERHDQEHAEPQVFATAASHADAIAGELRRCARSAYELRSTVAAGDWVAMRLGHGCRLALDAADIPGSAGRDTYSSQLWLMRFAAGRIAETWTFDDRYTRWLLLGRLKNHELIEKVGASGL